MSFLMKLPQRYPPMVGGMFAFSWQRKLWWLLLLAVLLLLVGILFVLTQMSSVAPWMYPL